MPNYRQVDVQGTSWQRSYSVRIDNKLGEIPSICFSEEEVVNFGEQFVTRHVGQLVELFDDPTKTFNLTNPETGEVVGVASYQDAYVMLSSLYLYLATKRDAV